MAIKSFGFASAGGGAGTDTLDDVTGRGATTTNAITVGGVSIGTEYSLPTTDGSTNQVLQTNGSGTISFATLDFTGGLEYKGAFNATAGTPSLANAEKGDFYIIDTAGTIYGQTWAVGDHLLINEDMGGTITNSKIDKIDNTQAVTSVNTQTGAVVLSGNDLAADHSASNYTPANSNIDGHFSGVDTKLGTLLSDITNESLNDLSDVSYTAGSGIDNYVLTYDHSTTSWGAEAVPVTSVNTQTGAVVLSGNDLAADHSASNYTPANSNIDGHLSGIDTALGASANPTLDGVTTNGNTTTNAINVGTITTSGDILADADATRTIGAEATRFITYHGDMNGAIRFKAKNNQGSAITKGQVVYISGVSGTVPEVKLAQANSASTMPAFGLALANANDQAEVQIITFGNLTDYNTTTYSLSANDTVFVSATTAGALTNSAPTGESNLIQNIGRVVRADASAGNIKVGGAGRSNATPNLDQDKVFLGNASNQSVSTALSAIGLSKFSNDSNFLTNINNESLNDLSDVSYTASSGIDNYVLTYDHSTTSWGAEAVPTGGYPVQTAIGGMDETGTGGSDNSTDINLNSALLLTAASANDVEVKLPLISTASDGDAVIIVRKNSGSLKISQHGSETVSNPIMYLDQGFGTSFTITNNQQQIHVRFDSAGSGRWYIYDKAQALVATTGAYSDLSGTPTALSDFTNDSGFITDVVNDTTPQLGGNLDVNGNDIVSVSNGDIEVAPDGTGSFIIKGNATSGSGRVVLNCEQNSHGITLKGPPHSAAASYTLTFPDTDGNADQVLKTDGSGNLDWVAQGSAPDVVTDSSGTNTTISTSTGIEEIHLISNGSNNVTITIPAASSVGEGYKYNIKRLGTGTVSVAPSSGTIDGSSSFSLATQYDSVTLVSDNSNYHII